MTKSEFIRHRTQPLIRMVEKFVHPEERGAVAIKVEIWVLRLIADVEHLGAIELGDMKGSDFPYIDPDL